MGAVVPRRLFRHPTKPKGKESVYRSASVAPVLLAFGGAAQGSGDMFAEGNTAVLREWKGILESQGWRGTVQRLNELCEFLVDEGLTWRMLGLMGDPSE